MQLSWAWTTLAISLVLPLSGCASLPFEQSTPTSKITLVTRSDLNPDASGRPSPVPVRIYLLKSPDKLSRADYFQIIDHERDLLGPDLISREEIVVRPGESQVIVLQGQSQDAAVGVVVGYRNIERAKWRVISPLSHSGELTVTLNATAVSVENIY